MLEPDRPFATLMLARMLEPEVMDSREDAWDYDSMDHAEVNRRFVDDLLAAGLVERPEARGQRPEARDEEDFTDSSTIRPSDDPTIRPSNHPTIRPSDHPTIRPSDAGESEIDEDIDPLLILDLGTGTAQIPIELCQRTDDVRIMAADAAISMLDLARLNVEIAGLRDQIQLDHADAKRMAYRDGMFDAVISNSIVHHIPEPQIVLKEVVRVTKPGGLIFFRDLLRPSDEVEIERLVELYAVGCNDHQRKLFRDSLHAALTVEEMRKMVSQLGFPADTIQRTSDRHWTWNARRC